MGKSAEKLAEKSTEKRRMKKGLFFVVLMLVGLLLIPFTHLGDTFGDWIFRSIGISPWTDEWNTGLHLPAILGIMALVIGFIGATRQLKPVYPKIISRLGWFCVAVLVLFPYITQGSLFLLKYNATGHDSIAIKDSQCKVNYEEADFRMECKVTLFNYGNIERVALKPILPPDLNNQVNATFESSSLRLDPHRKKTMTVAFAGVQQSNDRFSGTVREVDFEIEVEKSP